MPQIYRRHRYPTSFPIKIVSAVGPRPAVVTNVNEGGARITGFSDVEDGEHLSMISDVGPLRATVRWVADNDCGVAFRPMIDNRTLDVLRQAPVPTRVARYTSTGLPEMR